MPLSKELLTTQPQKSPWIPWKSLEVREAPILLEPRSQRVRAAFPQPGCWFAMLEVHFSLCVEQGRSVPPRIPTSARPPGSWAASPRPSSASNWPAGGTPPTPSTSASPGRRCTAPVSGDRGQGTREWGQGTGTREWGQEVPGTREWGQGVHGTSEWGQGIPDTSEWGQGQPR